MNQADTNEIKQAYAFQHALYLAQVKRYQVADDGAGEGRSMIRSMLLPSLVRSVEAKHKNTKGN